MGAPADRVDSSIHSQRHIIAIFAGDAPALDEQGRDPYFLLIQEVARLREEGEMEAGRATGSRSATGAEDRTGQGG
jgi:hypothetical protein